MSHLVLPHSSVVSVSKGLVKKPKPRKVNRRLARLLGVQGAAHFGNAYTFLLRWEFDCPNVHPKKRLGSAIFNFKSGRVERVFASREVLEQRTAKPNLNGRTEMFPRAWFDLLANDRRDGARQGAYMVSVHRRDYSRAVREICRRIGSLHEAGLVGELSERPRSRRLSRRPKAAGATSDD